MTISIYLQRTLALMVLLSLLAGCGGDVPPTATTGSDATTAPAQGTGGPGDVQLGKQGFGQQGRLVSIGFTVTNPHPDVISAVPYTVEVLDASGTVLQTVSGHIDLLLPGQETGVATEAAVPQQAQVASVAVKLQAGTTTRLQQNLQPLTIHTPSYGINPEVPGGLPVAVGLVGNPNRQPVEDVLVTMLLSDNDGKIIGAGSAMIDQIDASVQSGVQAQVITTADSTNLAMFASFTRGTIGQAPTPPQPPSDASAPLPGQKIEELPADHVPYSERIEYNSNPPTSGQHWQAWAAWGIFVGSVPFDEQLVHNLEHGGVIISYNPATVTDGEFAQLLELYRSYKQINYRFILAERKDLPSKFAMTAWGYLQTFETVDREAMNAFAIAHIAKGPECTAGECAP